MSNHYFKSYVSVDFILSYCARLTFAGLDTLEPRVLEIRVDLDGTVFEPSAATEAAAKFASIGDTAPGTLAR